MSALPAGVRVGGDGGLTGSRTFRLLLGCMRGVEEGL
jgi:hypothetical protein